MRRGLFVDPALGKDRFDFDGESLTQEDVDEYIRREEEGEEEE